MSGSAREPNVTMPMLSDGGFALTNASAAAAASAIAWPFIDRERSIASTTLLPRPRFAACTPPAGWPFSHTRGVRCAGFDVTTETVSVGYVPVSMPRTETAAPRAVSSLVC